jgi:hypothetical protein
MKLYTFNNISIIFICLLFSTLFLNTLSISLEKVEDKTDANVIKSESETSAEKEKKKSHKKSKSSSKLEAKNEAKSKSKQIEAFIPKVNQTDRLSNSTFRDLNLTFAKQDVNTFKARNRRWDFKLLDKQLEEIAEIMTYKEERYQTMDSKRAFIQLYVNEFESCDTNADNILDISEFTNCMKNDPYLYQLAPPPQRYAAIANYSDTSQFYPILFNIFDSYHNNYTNFHDYMFVRLLAFSWRKCSVMAPFIEEVNFECAIEIIAGYKTLTRNSARNLYNMGLQLANNEILRNLDFISFTVVASSVRLYSHINGKEDSDITRDELNLALDNNLLPMRYNQDVINGLFKLVEEFDKPNQGLDLVSFVYYDFALKLFDTNNPTRKYHMNLNEFNIAVSNYLFPQAITSELVVIPRNNLSDSSYQQYTYHNITLFNSEQDHFLKSASFLETQSNDNILTLVGNNTNFTYNSIKTNGYIFNIIDTDSDGWLNFYDWGSFFQIAFLYSKFDVYNKGRIIASELYTKFTTYSDYPFISYKLREAGKRFSMLPQSIYVDLLDSMLLLKLDEIMLSTIRSTDKENIYEYELKRVLASVNLRFIPDSTLNQCLRGVDDNKIPKYDWECAFTKSIILNLKFYESSFAYLTAKTQNLTLSNTIFMNVDPSIV